MADFRGQEMPGSREQTVPDGRGQETRVSLAARWLTIALVPAFLLAVNLFFQPIQIRIWNYYNWRDFLLMLALIAPFITTRWVAPAHHRATRVLWWMCAVMAIDVLAFFLGTFLPSGGHPSLEAMVSIFLGLLKIGLIPAGLVALVIASLRGERVRTVLLALACLIGQTLFTVPTPNHPFRWITFMRADGN